MNKKKGLLIVVSAPSGCGKGTILEAAMKRKEFCYSVSATTRSPRPGETDGVNYFFLDRERFEEMARNGEMLEYAEFVGNLYGTPRAPVEEKLAEGRDVILEIEVQGAMKVKKACPDAVLIFVLPPSVDVLRQRLYKRKTESEEVIEDRVAQAGREIGEAVNYDYAIVNDDLEKAVEDFLGVIQAEKLTVKRQKDTIDNIINEKQ